MLKWQTWFSRECLGFSVANHMPQWMREVVLAFDLRVVCVVWALQLQDHDDKRLECMRQMVFKTCDKIEESTA